MIWDLSVQAIESGEERIFLYLRENEVGMRLDPLRAAVAGHIRRADLAGDRDALRPPHGRRPTYIEPRVA